MLRSLDRRGEAVVRGLALVFSAVFVLLFLGAAWRRLHYPFEVDRMESGMVTSVWRLRHGYALYSAPSLTWAPFLYAPLFFYVSAAVAKVTGVGYASLRLVSSLATLGSFGLIYGLAYQETRPQKAPAVVAVGIFASLYPFVLAWYDVGRVDSLALTFFLAALLFTRRGAPVSAAVFWWLAFLTKQTFLPLGFAVFLTDWRKPRRMATGMAVYLVLVTASFLWLQHATQGWFRYYAFGTAGVIKWSLHNAVMFPFADLLNPLPIACGLIAVAAWITDVDWRGRDGSYFAGVTLLVGGAILFVRAHVGANLNAVIPLYAWLAVLAGVALHRLLQWLSALKLEGPEVMRSAKTTLWLLACVQLGAHLYRPAEIPTGNLEARTAFVNALRDTPGDVWVVDHSYDAILAGKPLHADMDALDAVLGRGYQPALTGFQKAVSQGTMAAVVLDRAPDAYEPKGLFTRPPFTDMYRLRADVPGAGAQGDLDQPTAALMSCTPIMGTGGLTDTRARMTDRTACATGGALR